MKKSSVHIYCYQPDSCFSLCILIPSCNKSSCAWSWSWHLILSIAHISPIKVSILVSNPIPPLWTSPNFLTSTAEIIQNIFLFRLFLYNYTCDQVDIKHARKELKLNQQTGESCTCSAQKKNSIFTWKNKPGLCPERSEIFYGEPYQRITEYFP